jgi:hypothetical protein
VPISEAKVAGKIALTDLRQCSFQKKCTVTTAVTTTTTTTTATAAAAAYQFFYISYS